MEIRSTCPDELTESERDDWRTWQYQSPGLASPFLAPEFADAMGRLRTGCRVLTVRDSAETVAFLPLEQSGWRRARAIGFGVSDAQGMVMRPGWTGTLAHVVKMAGIDFFEFDHLVLNQAPGGASTWHATGAPMMHLAEGYESYRRDRRSLSRSAFASVERKGRKLEREHGMLRFEYDTSDSGLLELMMKWKSDHYRRTGARDLFATVFGRRLVRDALATRTAGYAGVLSVLRVGPAPVAVEFGLRSRTVYERWFGGYDPRLGQYSPGLVALLRVAEACSADGIARIDLGKGSEPYKDHFADHHERIADGWVSRPSAAAAIHSMRRLPEREARVWLRQHPALRRRYRGAANAVNRFRRYGPARVTL